MSGPLIVSADRVSALMVNKEYMDKIKANSIVCKCGFENLAIMEKTKDGAEKYILPKKCRICNKSLVKSQTGGSIAKKSKKAKQRKSATKKTQKKTQK